MRIRPARDADLVELTDLYNHYVRDSHVTFDLEPYEPEARRVWLDGFAATGPHRLLVAVDGDDGSEGVVGYASSAPFRSKRGYAATVETTVYVHPSAIGRGIGRALYTELLAVLADERVHRAVAGVALPNVASIALHLDLGYVSVGAHTEIGLKHGRYIDVQWFERAMPWAGASDD